MNLLNLWFSIGAGLACLFFTAMSFASSWWFFEDQEPEAVVAWLGFGWVALGFGFLSYYLF